MGSRSAGSSGFAGKRRNAPPPSGYARSVNIEALYVHAPFCRRRCGYCDFAVTVAATADPEPWAETVARELASVLARAGWSVPLRPRTLYVGGGTPSLFGPAAMSWLREKLGGAVDFDSVREWTAEANPESFDDAVAEGWARAGVNRISLGAQTFHAPTLAWMGRLHGPEGPARALASAREAGIRNVSLDLIFAVPERLRRDWRRDLDIASRLEPDHLSLYGLTAEEGTPLRRWIAEGRERLPEPDGYAAEYLAAAHRLAADGWVHYEVSNFSRPGKASLHNEAYWNGSAYLGLGPGAHSYVAPRRWWNLRDWRAYRSAVTAGTSAVGDREILSGAEARLERIWLGLRTRFGLALDGPRSVEVANGWVARALAVVDHDAMPDASPSPRRTPATGARGGAGRVRLSAEGWLLLDRLAVEMDAAWESGEADCGHTTRGAAREGIRE